MIKSPFKRKILKITAYILGSLIVLLTAFHFWFVNHAEQLLEELVESRSNGKLKLHVKKFRFNWFSTDMQLHQAVFYSTDTATAPTAYRFSVERINVSVKEVLPLVFEKKIVIDSLTLINPDIRVTRLRTSADTDTNDNRTASLPQEMGRVYKSIQDALEVLSVTQFHIDNGKFTLINKMRKDELPVTITNIQLHLDNLQVDTTKADSKQKILFSDNVALQTHHQDILFPDGRHRLSFGNFRINILKRMVEFDSCTIAASKGDSAKTSFRIFFDKLRLTNIDFDTLYQKEVIKADSVYCINPQFRLDAELEKRSGAAITPPKLNELIQQLTGDLQVKFVIVQNGSFDINTIRDGKPSSFTSSNNNFEMQGLRIRKNSPQPLTVKSLVMAIHNYENFLRDSSYALRFDSILLINNSINLSNFTVKQMQQGNVVNSFSIPQFQLRNFSWDDLIFEQKLTAGQATLYRPVINYSFAANAAGKDKEQSLFQTLAGIGDILQLNNLDVANGRLNLNFTGGTQMQLENANFSIAGKEFVQSKQISNLKRSVRRLRFGKGVIRSGNLTIELENADITGKEGKLVAEKMFITDKEKNFIVNASGASVDNIQMDNNSVITEINGVQWEHADLQLKGLSVKNNISTPLAIKNIKGADTRLLTSDNDQQLTASFQTLSADEILLQPGNKLEIINLQANGKSFSYHNQHIDLKADHFLLADKQHSSFEKVSFSFVNGIDTTTAVIPSASFIPDINAIINGDIKADAVILDHPVISIKKHPSDQHGTDQENKLPVMSIGKITVRQPYLTIEQPGSSAFTRTAWHSKEGKNNSLELTNFRITDSSAIFTDQLLFSVNDFSLTTGGKTFNTGDGEIKATINNFYLEKTETGEWDWHGKIKELQAKNFISDSIGKNNGRFEIQSASLGNLSISSSTLLNIKQLVKENKDFRLTGITGKYSNTKHHFEWQNASYDRPAQQFSLESFAYHPALPKDEFMANQPYQTDYLTLQTGEVSISSFDLKKYVTDTVLKAGTLTISNAILKDYRDKRLPFEHGITKSLPAAILKKSPVQLDIDFIHVINADITYTEFNNKTNESGIVNLNRVNAMVSSAGNYNNRPGDSLTVKANGYLLDSVRINLLFKQSYADAREGFSMTATIGPADIKILNPVIIPLASLRVTSGIHDSLTMHATGDVNSSKGEMKALYRDLKIKLLNNNTTTKKRSESRGFLSFIANTFIIKNKNRSRTVPIVFERDKERSLFHYLWKTVLKGITMSIGLKKNLGTKKEP